ncbi:MAG: hypothetical protein Q7R49_04270 [Candidatus Daviesbacteria bacterium]|nr:hypothetical protein [Candidatus Daviesbacteria bacterium]
MNVNLKEFKVKILLTCVVTIFLIFTSLSYENKVFSPHFVDEEDNIILGKYLTQDEKLYKDLFSHHQPLAYIISASIQKATNPNSIYLLIKRHRDFIILWSFAWSILILLRFGVLGALFIIPFELLKFYLFGNLFLSESLAIYPFIYLIAMTFDVQKINKADLVFAGSCLGLVALLLSPLWLALIFLSIVFIVSKKVKLNNFLWIIVGTLPIAAISFYFVSLSGYLHNAFYINFAYYIPITQQESLLVAFTRGFVAPVLYFFSTVQNSQILVAIQFICALLTLNSLILIKSKRFLEVLLIFSVLGLSNPRFSEGGLQYYSGFHALPWLGAVILLTGFTTILVWKKYRQLFVRSILVIFVLVILTLSIHTSIDGLFTKHNISNDFYINYSRQFTFGEGIRIMKSSGDTLMVVPDEWLIYWQGNLPHSTKMINYYAWMSTVPELKNIVEDNFKKNPPTFFYCDCTGSYFGLEKYWGLYTVIKKDGKLTKLMVLKQKIKSLTKEQQDQLKYYNFDTITGND